MEIMKGFGKLLSGLIVFAISASWFVFTIWGIVTWEDNTRLVTNKTTIILLYIPLFIGMFALFVIVNAIASGSIKGKKKKKEKDELSWVPGSIKQKFSKTVVKEIGKSIEQEAAKEDADFSWVTDEMKEKFFKFMQEAQEKNKKNKEK